MTQTPIPSDELDIFTKLMEVHVVFDVGARTDVDYLRLMPDIELHAFEPNPEFFAELTSLVGDHSNVHLNNYGLSDRDEELPYNAAIQSFLGANEKNPILTLRTLDQYCADRKIDKIDFLKIDTEGFDYKVLCGAHDMIHNKEVRYIQYEHWDDKLCFHQLLEDRYIMCYTGYRNVLCIRKDQPWL